MARYYATFDGSTVASEEINATGRRRLRIPFVGDAAALRAALVSTRAALDAAIRPQFSGGNNDGTLGIVVPSDAPTRGSTNTTTELYVNAAAEWQNDPIVRPTADITVAGSTIVSPSNPLTIPNDLYDAATTAMTNACVGAGVYDRLGVDGEASLRSLYADHLLTYLAWDSFTPEAVQEESFLAINPPAPVSGQASSVQFEWLGLHPTDGYEAYADWEVSVGAIEQVGTAGSTGVQDYSASGTRTPGEPSTGVAESLTGLQSGFKYRVTATVQLRYPTTGVVGPIHTHTQEFTVFF